MEDCYKGNLDVIKENYAILLVKYGLPSWIDLEENFDVSKAFSEGSELVLRDIRRKMNEKMASYLHLFETFLNPQAAPMFILGVLKNLEEKDWEHIRKLYKELAKVQFQQILVDTIYSEDKEAKIIKEIFDIWQKHKHEILTIIEILAKRYEGSANSNSKSYFG